MFVCVMYASCFVVWTHISMTSMCRSLSLSLSLSLCAPVCVCVRVCVPVCVYMCKTYTYICIYMFVYRMCASNFVLSRPRSLSRIVHLNTSYRKAHAVPPSCPDYYADLFRAPLHEVLPKLSPPLHVMESGGIPDMVSQ